MSIASWAKKSKQAERAREPPATPKIRIPHASTESCRWAFRRRMGVHWLALRVTWYGLYFVGRSSALTATTTTGAAHTMTIGYLLFSYKNKQYLQLIVNREPHNLRRLSYKAAQLNPRWRWCHRCLILLCLRVTHQPILGLPVAFCVWLGEKSATPIPGFALKISFKKFIFVLILVQQKLLVHLYETLSVQGLSRARPLLCFVTGSWQL